MKEIGTNEVRKVLLEVFKGYPLTRAYIINKTDKQLLKTNLNYEFSMDANDFEKMFSILCDLYGIKVYICNPPSDCSFNKEQTVENFIKTVNCRLSHG